MSILIKGIEMPKNCWECAVQGNPVCIECLDFSTRRERPTGCPLVEVQPHGRLIDADELKKKHHWTDDLYETEYVEVFDIDNAPTIIEAEEVNI